MTNSSTTPAYHLLDRAMEAFAPELQLPAETGITINAAWSALRQQLGWSSDEVAEALAGMSGLQTETDELVVQNPALLSLLPQRVAHRSLVLPLRREGRYTVVAGPNPVDHEIVHDLSFTFDSRIRLVIASPEELEVAIEGAYGVAGHAGPMELESITSPSAPRESLERIPHLARQLLLRSIKEGASDIHLQPFVHGSIARIRVDGLLRRIALVPDAVAESVIRFFKAQADMDPTSHLAPQDGRMSVGHEGNSYDLRISTLPVAGGKEKLVIRILGSRKEYRLADLGMSLDEMRTIRRLAHQPSGVVLFCGPTGSGKTTSLYSILSELNSEAVSIATVENPVEYRLPGLAQSEVNTKAGMTFAASLRSLLRQDPDVILIGEIRDSETARIAIQAALTGHLVFSTLHTRNSVAAIPRLMDLDLNPVVLAESIVGVVSQRLLRRLCEACAEPASEPYSVGEKLFHDLTRVSPAMRPGGCEACFFTGYTGRLAVTEILEPGPGLAKAIASGETDESVLRNEAGDDFRSLSAGTARHIISGRTTVEEAERVLGRTFWKEVAEAYGADAPELSGLGGESGDSDDRTGVLVITSRPGDTEALQKALEQAWLQPLTAATPDEAREILDEHEDVAFVIVDLDPELGDDASCALIGELRTRLAWSRLPALILTAEGRDAVRERLVAEGATSPFLDRDTDPGEVVQTVSQALSSHVDFMWGRTGDR